MIRLLFTLCITLTLFACGSSSDSNSKTNGASSSQAPSTIDVTISIPDFTLAEGQAAIALFDGNDAFISSHFIEKADQALTLPLNTGSIYRAVFNPNNDIVSISCPLKGGCVDQNNEGYDYGETMRLRLSFGVYFYPEMASAIEISPLTQLAVRVMQSSYVDDNTLDSWMKVNSLMANTMGMFRYDSVYDAKLASDHWNSDIRQAINIGLLFEQSNQISGNATSRLDSVARRLTGSLNNNQGTWNQFFDFIMQDANAYLAEQSQSLTDKAAKQNNAEIRAYLMSKLLFPEKGFKPSPYLFETDIQQSKRFLDDYRSLLYTFVDNTPEYQQVVDATRSMNDFMTDLSNTIFTDLFDLFNDVLDEVPSNSDTGNYQLGELSIQYNNDDLHWQLTGDYKGLDVNLAVTLQSVSSNSFVGNRYQLVTDGTIDATETKLKLEQAEIVIFQNPPEDPFGGEADGSGHITVKSGIQVEQSNDNFAGDINIRLTTHMVNDQLIENAESMQVQGTLTNSGFEQDVSIILIHPDVMSETKDTLFSDNLVSAVTYSAPIKGLGEPLLTIYVPYLDLSKNLNIRDLNIIAYFEGRLTKFIYKGTVKNFDYLGENQDGVNWNLVYRKKETDGAVYHGKSEKGKPRVVKSLPGIMFEDGNFISIF